MLFKCKMYTVYRISNCNFNAESLQTQRKKCILHLEHFKPCVLMEMDLLYVKCKKKITITRRNGFLSAFNLQFFSSLFYGLYSSIVSYLKFENVRCLNKWCSKEIHRFISNADNICPIHSEWVNSKNGWIAKVIMTEKAKAKAKKGKPVPVQCKH